MAKTKFVLTEKSIPKAWYNIQADLPQPLPPVIHPGTGEPIGPDDLAPLFPMAVIGQEVSQERWIEIPDPVRDVLRLWRPTPLFRARRLEQALDTPAHIYYKYEGVSPAGSHKPNTADSPGLLQQGGGRQGPHDRDRRRPVGQLARDGLQLLRPRVRGLHGEGLLPAEALPAQPHADVRRERHAEPFRPDERGPLDPRAGSRVARLARHRHLGGGRGGGHQRRRQEVLARLGAEPCPPAPDRDRPRGARAVRAGGGVSRRRHRLRRRRVELRRLRAAVRPREPHERQEDANHRRRAHGCAEPHQGPLHLRLRRHRRVDAAPEDVHARPHLHPGAGSCRRPALPRHGADRVGARTSRG